MSRAGELLRQFISSNRTTRAVKALHRMASSIESAYENEGSSFERNGERRIIERLGAAGFTTAFDVGANAGDWLCSALAAWPLAQVHAFEVAPLTFERLCCRIARLSHGQRVTPNCLGLSDCEGAGEMLYFPDHPELTCDLPRHEAYKSVKFEARLSTGKSYAAAKDIGEIDFVKIDVEGAEYRVLRGFGYYLEEQKIHCLQFEYGAFSTQTRVLLADYYKLLSGGYWIGKIFPDCVEFSEYDWKMENFRFANFCCVSKRRPDLRDLLSGRSAA